MPRRPRRTSGASRPRTTGRRSSSSPTSSSTGTGRRPRPVVTLTTDFGLRDAFVGVLKGVILGICPDAVIVDLTHDVPRHDVLQAQLALEAAHRFFPPGTVHVAVVDPGVGGSRRAIAIEARGHHYVGPDNGLFTFALSGDFSAVSIESPEHRLPRVSATFHGRDVFAPAAAHLASGVALEALGPAVTDPVRAPIPSARRTGRDVLGAVLGADRFGNLVTSISAADIEWLGPGPVEVRVGRTDVGGLVGAYSEAGRGARGAILGSQGRLEIFVREGSALAAISPAPRAPVRVRSLRRRARAPG